MQLKKKVLMGVSGAILLGIIAMLITGLSERGKLLKTQLVTRTASDGSGFSVSFENAHTVSSGGQLTLAVGVGGASTAQRDGVSGLAVRLTNVPSYLTNPAITVNRSSWTTNQSALSGGTIEFTAMGTQNPLTSTADNLVTITFNVSGTVSSSTMSLSATVADSGIPYQEPSQDHPIAASSITLTAATASPSTTPTFTFHTNSPVTLTSGATQITFRVGVDGMSNTTGRRVNGLTANFNGFSTEFSSCTATTALSNWTVTPGNINNGFMRVVAIGTGNPLSTSTSEIFSMTCNLSGKISTSQVALSGEVTTDDDQLYYPSATTINIQYAGTSPSPSSSPANYSISGTITGSGVTTGAVTITCGSYNTTVGSGGVYTISNVPNGTSCALTPSRSGYTYNPTSRSVTINGSNVTGQNFVSSAVTSPSPSTSPSPTTRNISGTISGAVASGVTVTCGSYQATSASNGTYTITNVPQSTSCTLTPSLSGYTFNPTSYSITANSGTITGRNFTATANTYSISGTVSGTSVSSVNMTCGTYSATTNTSGVFTITGVPNGTSCALTPSKSGYTYTPTSRNVTISGSNVTSQNFTSSAVTSPSPSTSPSPTTRNISGTISGAVASGVTVTCGSYQATSASNGTYTITSVPQSTSCTLTPSRSGYTFSPTSRSVAANSGTLTGQNFTATAVVTTYTISGTISGDVLSGVQVTCGNYSATSNSSGSFSMTGVANGTSCILIPTLQGYDFNPENRTVNVNGANVTGQNFAATEQQAPPTGLPENVIIITAVILGVVGSVIFLGAKLKWF